MFQTMTQIGQTYNIEAKSVGAFLYKLNIRDSKHSEQKGFPFEQAITHGIAKAYESRAGETYYRYNIEPIKEEFEKLLSALPEPIVAQQAQQQEATIKMTGPTIETKLKEMLITLNTVLATGEIEKLYRLKADVADIYALLPSSR